MNSMAMFGPTRRSVLALSAALLGVTALPRIAFARGNAWVVIENFDAAGKSLGTARTQKLVKSETDWKKQLGDNSFEIARKAGTEPPFTGAYWNWRGDGLYRCLCCDTALFDSQTKFESGTGWPSFYQPISRRNVAQSQDDTLGMRRIAISCARCDAHLGHVFDDGPKPSGLRYCMNSAALRFAPRGKQQV